MQKTDISVGEFVALTRYVLHTAEFGQMKHYQHHRKSTLYHHSLKVAFLCYKYYKRHPRMGRTIGLRDFLLAALLHDYYLYDLHGAGEKHRLHWFRHPGAALRNALLAYPALTRGQRDMIKHHMFPLTLNPPRTRAGWLVCFYDKIAAIHDRYEAWFITYHKHFRSKTQNRIS